MIVIEEVELESNVSVLINEEDLSGIKGDTSNAGADLDYFCRETIII
jgi:hypothetical protein